MLKLFGGMRAQKQVDKTAQLHRNLMHAEAKIGGEIFGPVKPGGRREFFCLDEYTWIWHEEWLDDQKKYHVLTTRYDIRPNGIFKAQNGQSYQRLSKEEAVNLYNAMLVYERKVHDKLYPFVPYAT